MATPFRTAKFGDVEATDEIVRWWEEMTAKGGEGMVVKPADFVVHGKRGLVQPAIKCRGPEHLGRLRDRGLSTQRSMALRELHLALKVLSAS